MLGTVASATTTPVAAARQRAAITSRRKVIPHSIRQVDSGPDVNIIVLPWALRRKRLLHPIQQVAYIIEYFVHVIFALARSVFLDEFLEPI